MLFFIDYNRQRKRLLLIITLIISICALAVSTLEHSTLIFEYMKRERAYLSYWTAFKLPSRDLLSGVVISYESIGGSNDPQEAGGTSAEAVPVLLYHGEGNDTDMPVATFREQMKTLENNGWRTITLDQFERFMHDGKPVPAKSFLLTFDDGRSDTFYKADPVLKDLGLNAVMFVVTGFSLPDNGAKPINDFYLSRSELQYMADSGRWDLESHGDEDHRLYSVPVASSSATLSGAHFLSNKFTAETGGREETTAEYVHRVTTDLTDAKQTLENNFHKTITAFAYPFNDYGEASLNFPRSETLLADIVPSIYEFAFYQVSPRLVSPFNYPDPDTYMVKRIEPLSSWSGTYLLDLLTALGPKTLPYTATFLDNAWTDRWGTKLTSNNSTVLAASSTTSGALVLLSGSEQWTDYTFKVSARAESGGIFLFGRYADSGNKVSCAFGVNGVQIDQYVDGAKTVLARSKGDPGYDLSHDEQLGLDLRQNSASCTVNGKTILATDQVDPKLDKGRVGIETWNNGLDNAKADISGVTVTAL